MAPPSPGIHLSALLEYQLALAWHTSGLERSHFTWHASVTIAMHFHPVRYSLLKLAEAAVTANPNEGRAWCALGWARLRNQEEPKTAVEAFSKARSLTEQADEDLGACYGLAIACVRSDEAEGAAAWLEKARAFAKDNPEDAQEVEHLRQEAEAALGLQGR